MTTPTAFDRRALRDALGTFVTGVTVVTTCDAEGKFHGVTANSFNSVSLDPPLVLWSQSTSTSSHPAFRDSQHFVVNILADDQVALSNHFARSQPDKFGSVAHSAGLGGCPVLDGAAAHFECTKVATYPGGDHVVYIGQVEHISQSGRRPLAFGQGRYLVPYAHDLGPMSLGVGQAIAAPSAAVALVSQALPAISRSLGDHTLCLSVWGNHGPTAIRWEPGAQPVSDQLRAGLVMSVTRSATGRAFAAFLPHEVTRTFVDEDLRLSRASDENEAAQRAHFLRELEHAREHGVARAANPEPSILHRVAVNAFSAPIRDGEGRMIMALSVTSQAARLAPDAGGPVPARLREAAAELSQHIAGAA